MSEVNRISNVNQNKINGIKSSKNAGVNNNFSSFLGESKSLNEIFETASQKYNVPTNLLKAIGKQESNFNPNAVSRCGAQGVMQLMPATAASLGVTDSYDAEQNIMGGTKYISGLLKKYDGNTSLALAAYNAGSGNVAKYGGIPPFEETQNYVKKVTGYMNQGVDVPSSTYTGSANTLSAQKIVTARALYNGTGIYVDDSSNTGEVKQDLDSVFTYDDYMLLLDKLLNNDNDDKKDNNDKEDNYLSTQKINYNVPVMNLLNTIN